MKKAKNLKFLVNMGFVSTILFFSFFNSSKIFAVSEVNSPSLDGQVGGLILKKIDNSGVNINVWMSCTLRKGYINKNGVCYGNYLTMTVSPMSGALNIIDDATEKLFAVIVDNITKKPIKRGFLQKSTTSQNVLYGVSATVPYYFNEFDVYLYKQKKDEEDFTIKEENCFGKATVHVINQLVYQRGKKTRLKAYDNKGQEKPDYKSYFLSKMAPNYYSISDEEYGDSGQVGKIVLKDSQKNLLTEDQKIVLINKFVPSKAIEKVSELEKEKWNNSIYKDASYFCFYIPKEVDEFKFLVYKDIVTDKLEDARDIYYIKLNKK